MTTIEKLAGITAQHNEIVKRVVNGSLDIDNVRKALQDIIQGKFPEKMIPPVIASGAHSWYVSPEQQLKHVRDLIATHGWGFSDTDFPSIPEFKLRTETEVLLLCVYLPAKGSKPGVLRTFDELWDAYESPTGYSKWRWPEFKATAKLLRQAPGYYHTPGIHWVAFDPNTYHGLSPEAALKQSKIDGVVLAGVEGLMANLLFPTWATSWDGNKSPYPWLSGLQFNWNSNWSDSVYLYRWADVRQVRVLAGWSGGVDSRFGSPSVREC